jgi:hypothetical protein
MDKTSNNMGTDTTAGSTKKDVEYSSTTKRERITGAAGGTARPSGAEANMDADEIDRLARRYSREAQLALEGALYWALRWPFELMAGLVSAGRKWEEEYYRSTAKRRVSLYDDEM